MIKQEKLGQLFYPVQPRAIEAGHCVSYHELLPDPLLSGFICCYWQLKSTVAMVAPFTYPVVTDACIDFFFDLDNENQNFVVGFSSSSTSFSLEHSFNYVGIRFFPGAFASLYHLPSSQLTNQVQLLSDVIPGDSKSLSQLVAGQTNIERIKPLLDQHFKERVAKWGKVDFRFAASLSAILVAPGTFSIERDLASFGSARHLRRLFDYYIGVSPKEFHKVVRFQKLLAKYPTRQFRRTEKLYYDAGYYDQSHFIRDFKLLYGVAPGKAFAG